MIAKLTVYEVRECGYYAAGGAAPTCCDLRGAMAEIHHWIQNVQPRFADTATFEPAGDGAYLPVYCFGTAKHGQNDFLITTWNETPSDNGTVGAVPRDDTAGQANVQTANLPEDAIPGYGTHFWILPDLERVVTVRFDSQPLNGHVGLNQFMRGFLERFSRHVRFHPAHDHDGVFVRPIIGYAVDHDGNEAHAGLRPRFKSSLLRRNAELAHIRRHRASIKKVIRKGRPQSGGQVTRSLLDRMLTFVGAEPNRRALPDTNYSFEIPYTPTEAELNNIIQRWEGEEHEMWDDIGFDFAGDPLRRWLSGATLKAEVEVPDNLHDGAGSVARAATLLQAIRGFRAIVSA